MRYGVVRESPSLPPPAVQRRLLDGAACDVVLQEGQPTPEAQRRLARLLFGLKPGDEVLVHSLDVFQRSTGELAQLIRNFLEVGVSLRIVGDRAEGEALKPEQNVLKVLSLLAEHESRRPSRTPPGAGSRFNSGSRNALSKYQVDYARKLYREGASLRSIGLLFQVSPNEVWAAIGDQA
ncbi:site-specific recombinase, resolvase family [Phenylobacterium zucineum HLK1]|uniref:Site-specific recombinase, resolvase family n=1 Tax=Phenylobacterium zucineum (strain HLK1) TaxID=450851 RepID=B4RFJ8_PHEZH|nr:recombinase family protein [Phenylobacterium zucineum]ACG77079.1 site-specific recombinase, resolvase family [Phenylobacterium zucineum HLK1]